MSVSMAPGIERHRRHAGGRSQRQRPQPIAVCPGRMDPSARLVAIVIILNAVGLPPEGIGLILAVDRMLDMCRTAVNVFSDSCGAVIIGRSEGENDILREPVAELPAR